MSRAVKANNLITSFGKTNVIIVSVIVLIIGFVSGILFVLHLQDSDVETDKGIAYSCKDDDIYYLGDQMCADEYGHNSYKPIQVDFDLEDYREDPTAFNIYNVVPLLLDSEKPNYLRNIDTYYIVSTTTFNVASSIDVSNANDAL